MDASGMFSDDQMAIIGCFFALAVCGMIAAISFHFGPAGRQDKPDRCTPQPQTAPRIVTRSEYASGSPSCLSVC